jgi:hypothetical protein
MAGGAPVTAIIVGDLRSNGKGWLLCAILISVTLAVGHFLPLSLRSGNVLDGFLKGLVLAGTLVFAHRMFVSARGGRDLALGKMPSVKALEIAVAKFIALALPAWSLLSLSYVGSLIDSAAFPWSLWLLEHSMLALYVSSLLVCAFAFKRAALLFVPLYVAMGFYFFGGGTWTREMVSDPSRLGSRFWILPATFLLLSLALVALGSVLGTKRRPDTPGRD